MVGSSWAEFPCDTGSRLEDKMNEGNQINHNSTVLATRICGDRYAASVLTERVRPFIERILG